MQRITRRCAETGMRTGDWLWTDLNLCDAVQATRYNYNLREKTALVQVRFPSPRLPPNG